MLDFFKGETVNIHRKAYDGVDAGNNPIETYTIIPVTDVLVSTENTTVDSSVEEPLSIETILMLQFKPNVVINLDDVFEVRGTKWSQQGLARVVQPTGFRARPTGWAPNRRQTVRVKQVLGVS